ncbi:MAG: phosphotransferase [Bdellovibrionota bacterium]
MHPSPEGFQKLAETGQEQFSGWRNFAQARSLVSQLSNPWIERNLVTLVQLEKKWDQVAQGTSLVHADLRADQILIAGDQAVFLDWPHAKIGAPWIDFLFMFPSIVLQKGPSMKRLVERSPLARVPESELLPMAVALAGFFLWN